jgi:hypothetical protein
VIDLYLIHQGRVSRYRCSLVVEVESHLEGPWDQAFAHQAGEWLELIDARWKRLDSPPTVLKDDTNRRRTTGAGRGASKAS